MGARRRESWVDERISVVVPAGPPVLTPRAAVALLQLLRNVYQSRECEARQTDGSRLARVDDHDKGRKAA